MVRSSALKLTIATIRASTTTLLRPAVPTSKVIIHRIESTALWGHGISETDGERLGNNAEGLSALNMLTILL